MPLPAVEIEVVTNEGASPGVPMIRVAGYPGFRELWVYRADDGELCSVAPLHGLHGCYVPRDPRGPWLSLEAIVAIACAER